MFVMLVRSEIRSVPSRPVMMIVVMLMILILWPGTTLGYWSIPTIPRSKNSIQDTMRGFNFYVVTCSDTCFMMCHRWCTPEKGSSSDSKSFHNKLLFYSSASLAKYDRASSSSVPVFTLSTADVHSSFG